MESTCQGIVATPVPYTLLGFLLWGDRSLPSPPDANCTFVGLDWFMFMRDYAERATNALLWFALLSVTAILLKRIAGLVRLWALGSRIPGPPCHDFFGHSRLVRCGEDLTVYLSKLHEKYGSIVKLWLGPTQLLVSVKDLVTVRDVLLKAKDKLPLTGRTFRLAFGGSSVFAPSFEKVKLRRESLEFHLNKKFSERGNIIPAKVVDCVLKRVEPVRDSGVLGCCSVSLHLAFYILGATIFGDAFFAWSSAGVYEELLMEIAKDAKFWASYTIPPVWKKGFWRYLYLCSRLKYLTKSIIQQCRQNSNLFDQLGQSSYNKTVDVGRKEADKSDTLLLEDMMKEDFCLDEFFLRLIPKEEPCENVTGVMLHGFMRIASLMSSIFTRLVLHPEIQEQIYSEITEMSRKQPEPYPCDVQKMQLLMSTVYESARLLPEGPLLQRCSLEHDLNLGTSITVPAGAILVVPVQLVHLDYSLWGSDACQFHPQRFFSKQIRCGSCDAGKKQLSSFAGIPEEGDNYETCHFDLSELDKTAAFLSFGFGTRACIGQKYVVHGISTLLAYVLQNYEIKLHSGSDSDPQPTLKDHGLQLLPSPEIVFVKRNN